MLPDVPQTSLSGKDSLCTTVICMLYLLRVLSGPVDVVAPGNDDGKLVTDTQSGI